VAKNCRDCGVKTCNPLMPRCYNCSIAYMQTQEFKDKKSKLKAKSDERAAKRERKRLKDRKDGLKKPAEWAKEAQTAVNRYVRLRDHLEPCISCGRHHQGQYHAGHYRSVGSCVELRFAVDENIHKQCAPCNNHLSGNLIPYRVNLIKKIGQEKLDWLEGKHEAKHYTIDDFKAIKDKYNKLANELQNKIDKGEL